MAVACCEISERHPECTTDFRFQMMHRAGEAVGREPLRERIGLDERAIDFLRPGCQDAVQANSVGHGRFPVAELIEWMRP
jgi:hypothetical protein